MGKSIKVIEEEFTEVDTRTVDDRNRLTLGTLMAKIKRVRVSVNDRGDILLQPVVEIPASEHWLFNNKEARESVKRGLRDAAEGKISKLDTQEL